MKKLLAFAWLALSAFPVWAQDEQPKFPENQGAVNDFANILSEQAKAELHSVVDTFRDTKGPCVVVVTTPSLYGLAVEDYTNQLFKKWKIGHKNNDGIIFLIAPNERKTRIEVGYGLEPTIPDLVAKRILAEAVRPFLKDNKWDAGILAGTKAIVAKLGGPAAELPEPVTPAPASVPHHSNSGGLKLSDIPWWAWVVGVLIILFIISLVRSGEDGIAGFFLGAMMSGGGGGGGGGGWSSGGGGGGGGGSSSSSSGGGDSGGGGASDSF